MKKKQDLRIDIIQDIASLYELSLSIGYSLNIQENCDKFINTLMSRKKIDFASLWLKNQSHQQSTGYNLSYSFPEYNSDIKNIEDNHPIIKLLQGNKFIVRRSKR